MIHPEKLGKYRITGILGEGAMGVVYRGFDPDIRRVVALKTIRHVNGEGTESATQSAARFRNEAQAAGRLMHPGIVGVYDFGDDGRVAYIAMELVEGHTLSSYLAQKVRFSTTDIASLSVQLLDALGHAHEHGVWHRDVKPSNVIMMRSGRIKIADFGIARTDTSGLTMAGGVLGTPMYMAPEQFLGQAIDHRVDLYGAGVLLDQLVAGRPPFVGTPESLIYRVVHEPPQPPSSVEGGSHQGLYDLVAMKALSKDPRERFPHAAEFRDAVAAALGAMPPNAVSPGAVAALPAYDDYAPTQRIVSPIAAATAVAAAPHSQGGTVLHWDPAVLAQVEASLAKHVGPLAGTMVRRAARNCRDVQTLQSRLAEQITQVSVREAFLGQLRRSGLATGTGGTGGSGGSHGSAGSGRGLAPSAGTGVSAPGPRVSDAVLEQAERVLATKLGPIARVVVKRAAERTRQRDAFFAMLADAVPEGARAKLLAELAKLA